MKKKKSRKPVSLWLSLSAQAWLELLEKNKEKQAKT